MLTFLSFPGRSTRRPTVALPNVQCCDIGPAVSGKKFSVFSSLFRRRSRAPQWHAPPGKRCYAIGDVHGRADLLDLLLDRIRSDVSARPAAETFIVFLGDLIDRGPASAQVIKFLRTWRPDWTRTIFLLGNHEEAFLRALGGDLEVLRSWLGFGGEACARSYGVSFDAATTVSAETMLAALQRAVPAADRAFIEGFYDTFSFGDYVLVHAGLRPGVPIEEQAPADLRWIRSGFLDNDAPHAKLVVHGHSIVAEPEQRPNRIAIDTGAYRTGVLTAVRLEAGERAFLQVAGAPVDPDRPGAHSG